MGLKRFAAAALAFCLMLTLLPGGMSAVAASGDGWTLSADGELNVTENVSSRSGSKWSECAADIRTVLVGRDVSEVNGNAFASCVNLKSFKVEPGNGAFSAGEDGVLYSADGRELVCYPAALTGSYAGRDGVYMVPKRVAMVRPFAFEGLLTNNKTLEIYAYAETIESVASYVNSHVGEDFPGGMLKPPYVPVTGVRLDRDTLPLQIGKTAKLHATVLPEGATFPEISWRSEITEFATVVGDGSTGDVKGVSSGTTNIVVTTADGEFTASCTVTVVKSPVNKLILSPNELTLNMGETGELTAEIQPYYATYKNISFLSTDANVVTIDETGKIDKDETTGAVTFAVTEDKPNTTASVKINIIGKNPGAASIIATTEDGDFFAVCEVTVKSSAFTLSEPSLELTLPAAPAETKPHVTLTATYEGDLFPAVRWYSTDKAVVTVSDTGGGAAEVTAAGPGRAFVAARAEDGREARCAVTVWDTPTGAGISMTELTLAPTEEKRLYAVILPATAEQDVVWSTSKADVATVDQKTGLVTAEGNGEATITARSVKYGNITAQCNVMVKTALQDLTLSQNTLVLNESGSASDTTATLQAQFTPATASEQTVTWISYDETVATVVGGVVTAGRPGTTKILAVSADGGKTAVCDVTVNATKITGVKLDQHTLTLNLNTKSAVLTAEVEPEGARNQTYDFSFACDNPAVIELSGGSGAGQTVTAKTLSNATATVTVTVTKDGRSFQDTCTVTVVPTAVESVTVAPKELSLVVGETSAQLAVQSSPALDWEKIEWESSAAAVATVSSDGTVKAESVGTALITATMTDNLGQKYAASCAVTVKPKRVDRFELDKDTISLQQKESASDGKVDSATLTAKLYPYDATDRTVTFISTDPGVLQIDVPGSGKVVKPAEGGGTEENGEISPATAEITCKALEPGTAEILAITRDGGITARCAVTVYQPVTTISVHKSEVTLDIDESDTLTAIIMPETASRNVEWKSSAEDVVEIEETSDPATVVIKAKAGGTATITVTSVPDGKTATCAVTVRAPAIPVTEVELDRTEYMLELGGPEQNATVNLNASVKPASATNQTIHWYSSNRDVADVTLVNGYGHVTAAKHAGTAVIIAVSDDGGKIAYCTVTVRNAVSIVKLNTNELKLKEKETGGLTATVIPLDTNYPADQSVTWTSSAPGVATVQNGVVTALTEGTATITATSVADENRSASCVVTVEKASISTTGITLQKKNGDGSAVNSLTLRNRNGEESATLVASIQPSTASDQVVKWTSTDTHVVSVSVSEGDTREATVTAVGPGTATILATTAGGAQMAWCAVKVEAWVTGVSLNLNNLTIGLEDQMLETLTATVEPYNAENTAVEFTFTEGTDVIDLVGAGSSVAVIPKGVGTATVTVTTADGGKTAFCNVTVQEDAVYSVKINPTSLSLDKGETSAPLSVKISPQISTASAVEWASSNPQVATVDEDGGTVTVTAENLGTALITAKVIDKTGRIYTSSCVVTVKPVPVTGIAPVTRPFLTLPKNATQRLEPEVLPKEATDRSLRWSSSDDQVAEVNEQGEVKARDAGTAVIVASTKDGGFAVSYVVTVTDPNAGTGTEELKLSRTELPLVYIRGKEESAELTATVAGVAGPHVDWSSSNPAVAEVDGSGNATTKITAAGKGTAIITAAYTRDDGKKLTATCVVAVHAAVTELKLDRPGVTLEIGGVTTATLIATVTPDDASDTTVTWHSSNDDVAKVDDSGNATATITAAGKGTAVIVATTADGHAATCTVTVTERTTSVTGVSLNETALTLKAADGEKPAESKELKASVQPIFASNQNVSWLSTNTGVATVSADENDTSKATVKAVAPGTAVIIAATEDGRYTAVCTVTVPGPAVAIEMDKTLTMYAGEGENNVSLVAKVTPGGVYESLNWFTSDKNVAEVTGYGLSASVKAVNPGPAVITAATPDGKYTATCVVAVWKHTQTITLSKMSLNLAVDDTWDLVATVGENENPAVQWSIRDPDAGVVKVKNGHVTAEKPGTAEILVTAADGRVSAVCTVTVSEYIVSDTVKAPTITIREGEEGGKIVTLKAEDGDAIWFTTGPGQYTDYSTLDDPEIKISADTTIRAYAVRGNYQSAVITGVIGVTAASNKMVLTDKMGNEIKSLAEAGEDLSFTANITLSDLAAEMASDIYIAFYDKDGNLISLEKFELESGGTEGTETLAETDDQDNPDNPSDPDESEDQVISQYFKLKIPEGKTIGSIKLMVLSAGKKPVMGAGILGS